MLIQDPTFIIPTDKEITHNRNAAEKKMKMFSSEQISLMRVKAKHDLYWLAYAILGYDKLSVKLHKELCEWYHLTDGEQFRCILLPRSHYKSTITTISDTIRIILTDDLQTAPYPRNLGPNCRVLVAHEVADAASIFLHSITGHFLGNPMLMGLFPELIPDLRKQRVNRNELELPRTSIWSEPTVDTMGVGGRKQGRHYNYLKLDDLYGAAARDSEAEKKSTLLWFDNIQSFLVTPLTDHFDLVGTRWAFDDVYQHAFTVYEDKLLKYVRSCLEKNLKTGKLEPIFPEEFTLESLKILMKNRTVWNAQYANNPREGGTLFQTEWKRYYNYSNRSSLTVFNGSDSFTRDVRELDRVILIDPAMSGPAGFIVTGTDTRNNVFILEAEKKEWKPPELVDKIFQAVLRWQPRVVAIEEVLFSGLFQHWLATEMNVRGIKFKIIPVKTRQRAKEARVLGLSNYFQAGQIYFNSGQVDLIEEYDQFGATDNYHMLDALAYGPELWRAPIRQTTIDARRQAEEAILDDRDAMTGYSSY